MTALLWCAAFNWLSMPLAALVVFVINRRVYAVRSPMVVCDAGPFVTWCFENKLVDTLSGGFRARAFTWCWLMVTFGPKLDTSTLADVRTLRHERNHAVWNLALGFIYTALYLLAMLWLAVDGNPKTSPYHDNPLEKMAERAEDEE